MGRSPERAQATLAQLRERFPDLRSAIAHDVSAAARRADLIVCLTSAAKPYPHTGDVRPGTTIAAVGSDTPEKHELSTELLASTTLVCDVTHHRAHARELHHALEAAVITLAGLRSEIGDVIAGARDGRRTQDKIVIFDSTATAVQDTAPAAALDLATQNPQKPTPGR